jgi:hypothetical protein
MQSCAYRGHRGSRTQLVGYPRCAQKVVWGAIALVDPAILMMMGEELAMTFAEAQASCTSALRCKLTAA